MIGTEQGFDTANSNNMPIVDMFTVVEFLTNRNLFSHDKIGGSKTNSEISYGDKAVGYVQLKREGKMCILKAKICNRHGAGSKQYNVTVRIDEEKQEITSYNCHNCDTSTDGTGECTTGCMHIACFVLWLHRRSEDPPYAETKCYWKKPENCSMPKFVTVKDFQARTAN